MNAITHPDTQIVADDTVPAIRIAREFSSPVVNVFRAHTEAELFARWVGPYDLATTIGDWDCRTGGAWSFHQTDAEGDEYRFYGSFHEVRPDELIVQTFTFAGWPDEVSLDRITFEDLGGRRCRLTAVSTFATFEARDAMIASGMESGVREGYEQLDDLLAAGFPDAASA